MKGRCPRPLDDGDVYDPRTCKSIPSLSPVIIIAIASGGARRDRTVDLYTASVALSQLSYSPSDLEGARKIRSDLNLVKH